MRFRLTTSPGDRITFPQHLIEALCSHALMPQNHLHLKLLFTIDHNRWRWSLHPFKLLRPVIPLQAGYMKDKMNLPSWGQIQPTSHWRNHLGDWEWPNPPTPKDVLSSKKSPNSNGTTKKRVCNRYPLQTCWNVTWHLMLIHFCSRCLPLLTQLPLL